ncbi:MAG: antitoxin MazE family protein [Sphingomonadales bacterium]
MTAVAGPKSSRLKVRDHRERLRRQGLRPIQIWVPDVRAPWFKAEAHRQSLAVAASGHARDDQAFIDAVSDWDDERGGATSGQSPAARTMPASRVPSSLSRTTVLTPPTP